MNETEHVDAGDAGFEIVDRRRLVLGGLAAVASAGAVASVAGPAAAANGGPVVLGAANTASATTKVTTTTGNALQGSTSATGGYGVLGSSSHGNGVYGTSSAAGYTAVLGKNTNTTTGGFGVRGVAGSKGSGVRGETSDPGGWGVNGVHLSGGSGIFGFSAGGIGVSGGTETGHGVSGFATGQDGLGVYGTASGATSTGVLGEGHVGVRGIGQTGVIGVSSGPNVPQYAGYFFGNVEVTGNLEVLGHMSKGGGSFRIDHPLDPGNKFLSHSFVESPDMMNIYNGEVELDDQGGATVEMPDWFEALNRDFRYQLTALDGPAPELHVSSRIKDRSFTIAGGGKGQEVSWQVTGIRRDAWANANRIPVEEDKTDAQRGKYLHPELIKGSTAKPLHERPKPPVKTPPKPAAPVDVPVR